eukprot:2325967-Amphidinium_carterae.1
METEVENFARFGEALRFKLPPEAQLEECNTNKGLNVKPEYPRKGLGLLCSSVPAEYHLKSKMQAFKLNDEQNNDAPACQEARFDSNHSP